MPRLEAPSISSTSSEADPVISTQDSHSLQGVGEGPWAQFSALARIRATDVLPIPRAPLSRYAWAILSAEIALVKVWTTCGWPTTSSKLWGRHLRANTR